ncbi:MAG TPA: PH domain-containing protein [Candidatus Dormibacteraeota bacterium]|nr:PH domain-containing protein [Candidatus Dormibacteraeota bacterium]
MVSKQSVDEQLKHLGFSLNGWGRAEIRELPHILLPGEEIYELVNGMYEGGFALAVATDIRLLLVDKKPMNYLTVEDIRFEMINEIDYSHRLLGAHIRVATGFKELIFRSYNQRRLRKMISHVQHFMAEGKKQQSENQQGQSQHLQSINQRLQAYLKAQSDYQARLQRFQESQQAGNQALTAPSEPPTPSHELSDYLFARSLLAEYEAQTGKKLQPDLIEDATLASGPELNDTPLPSRRELHELWSAGVKEVFSGHHRPHVHSTTQATTKQHHSFEIHPASIVFSKLPMLIRSRRFTRPSSQLSSETFAG